MTGPMRIFVLLMVLAGLVARGGSVAMFYAASSSPDHAAAQDRLAENALPYCFSADAEVLLGVGPDGKPGLAGVDDNVNDIVDERSEMGAVGSDDLCLGPADDGYSDLKADDESIVISRGAFVPCDPGNPAERFLTAQNGWIIAE